MSEFFSDDIEEVTVGDSEILSLYHSLTKEQSKTVYALMKELAGK